MAKPLLNTISTSETFGDLLVKTNSIISLLSTDIVTASPSGDTATGDSSITGDFVSGNITSTKIKTDNIVPKIGNTLDILSPLLINSSVQSALTLRNIDGPKLKYVGGGDEWEIGFKDTVSKSFVFSYGNADIATISIDGELKTNGMIVSETVTASSFTGNLTGNASTVTNGVYTSGNQTINGVKTFSSSPVIPMNSGTLNMLRSDRSLIASTGLVGGGNLSANRSFSLTGQALALYNISTNGFLVRVAASNFVTRSIVGGTGVTVVNGNGVSSNPTLYVNIADQSDIEDGIVTNKFMSISGGANRGSNSISRWTYRTSPDNGVWNALSRSYDMCVAVGTGISGFCVATSTDGIIWTSRATPANNNWVAVSDYSIYGRFAVSNTGTNNRMMSATDDAVAWSTVAGIPNYDWSCLATYPDGSVAVVLSATGNHVLRRLAFGPWTSSSGAADNQWTSVCYGNGKFVAVAKSGTGNRVQTSVDGATWTIRTSAANNNWTSVCYGNGLFVAVSNSGTGNRVMTSPDGVTWTIRTSAANNWSSVTYHSGIFVAVATSGNDIMYSENGIDWYLKSIKPVGNWNAISGGVGGFIAVGTSTNTDNRIISTL